jgi:hypothetical protein
METNYQCLFSGKNCPSSVISRKNIWKYKCGVTYTHTAFAFLQKNRRTPYKPLLTTLINMFLSIGKHINLLKLKYKKLFTNILNHAKGTISKL